MCSPSQTHHLVADAWSIHVLQHDLAALYTMEVTGAGALPAIDLSVGEIHALEDRHEHVLGTGLTGAAS